VVEDERPRKALDYETPAEKFDHVLRASIEPELQSRANFPV